MALSAIVKNIYTFANILSQAGTDAVKSWNEKSLQNALNWAAYCTQISEQTQNATYRSDLDIQVQSFTVYVKPPSLMILTLDSLAQAKDILCKRLLQNSYCPDDIVQKINDLQLNDVSIYDQRLRRIPHLGNSGQHLYLLLGEEPEFDQSPSSIAGSRILDRLLHLENLAPVTEVRFNKFLQLIVPKISTYNRGMEILAKLLLRDVFCINRHSDIERIKQQIVDIIIGCCDESSGIWGLDSEILCELSSRDDGFMNHHIHGIWGLDSQILCELSSRDDVFLNHHIQYILSWVNNMVPVYGTTENGELFTWRIQITLQCLRRVRRWVVTAFTGAENLIKQLTRWHLHISNLKPGL